MEYPKTVLLENPKLKELLQQKNDLILEGREVSQEIIDKENEMEAIDKEIQAIEKAVDVKELETEAKAVTEEMNGILKRMAEVKEKLKVRLKENVAPAVIETYETAKLKKEELEKKRNKIGLKVQKFNDKIIPMTQKLMKPYLKDLYDDYDSIRVENGEVIGTVFNHMDDFVKRFAEKTKK